MVTMIDSMYFKVEEFARTNNMEQTSKALVIMKEKHSGQFRKGEDHLPYIVHPLKMACHALSMHLYEDELIATLLLHDVVEDCHVPVLSLDVNDIVRQNVFNVTYEKLEGRSKEESIAAYYKKIYSSRISCLVKLFDRCNNVSTMAYSFTRERLEKYVGETEKYVLPLLSHVKATYPEYEHVTFLIEYQMLSILKSVKYLIKESTSSDK